MTIGWRWAGNLAWLNPDGMGGDTWLPFELPPPPSSPSTDDDGSKDTGDVFSGGGAGFSTTCYNGVAAVNETHGVFTFDNGRDTFAVPFALV